jgi:hypothetical protein
VTSGLKTVLEGDLHFDLRERAGAPVSMLRVLNMFDGRLSFDLRQHAGTPILEGDLRALRCRLGDQGRGRRWRRGRRPC